MKTVGIVIGLAILVAVGWILWTFMGLGDKFREFTLEDRARSAIQGLRERVSDNRDKARSFKIQAEMQKIKLERMAEEQARLDSAARSIGEAGRQAEAAGSTDSMSYRGKTITLADARRRTIAWGTKAQSLLRQMESREKIRARYLKAIDTLESSNTTLTVKIGELELKLEEMLVQKEEAELLATLSDVNRAFTTGEGTGELGVFKELQDKIDEATATARVLDGELASSFDESDTPLETEILDKYWQ